MVEPYGPPMAKSNRNAVLLTVIVTAAIVAMVALIAYVQSIPHSSADLTMTNWEHTSTSSAGGVIFLVDVMNRGGSVGTATIHCAVTYENGETFSDNQYIALAPGASDRFIVTVVISLSHTLDSSGVFDCRLITPIE